MGSSSPPILSHEGERQASEIDVQLHELFRPPSTGQSEPSSDKQEPQFHGGYELQSGPNAERTLNVYKEDRSTPNLPIADHIRSTSNKVEETAVSEQSFSKKRKTNRLAAYMARTTSSIAFAKFEKILDESPQPRSSLPETTNLKLATPSVCGEPNIERLGSYTCRPFQGADFDIPIPSLETNEHFPVADAHGDTEEGEGHGPSSDSTVELAALARITDKIAAVSEEIRLSESQLTDARERLAEVNCEVRELAETFSRSWQEIESWQGNPRDTPNWDAAPSSTAMKIISFNTIEVQLKDLTRKKRLIESEIKDREAKKKSVDGAISAFLASEKWNDLETLEDAANDYVPMTTGL